MTCIEDWISRLPDEILCRILSFLYTKEAVKTSILSHRWNNAWASVPNLDFSVRSPKVVSDRCAGFVDKVFSSRGPSNIHRLQLQCADIEDYFSRIDNWICTAIARKVVELDLCLDSSSRQCFELPRSLFMCNTLEVLKLRVKSNLISRPPTSNCFPCLKHLHVTIYRPNSDSIENLFPSCPVLEDLIIDGRVGHQSVMPLNVSAPKLKRLRIRLYGPLYKIIYIDAHAPNLETFNLKENFLKNTDSLSKAKIAPRVPVICYPARDLAFSLDHVDQISMLLAGINKVKYLSFSAPILEDPDIMHRYRLPTFNNLNHLKLRLQTCCAWKSLTNWLHISPNLEHLVLKKNILGFWKHDEDAQLVHEWCPPEVVPVCLLSSLKTIFIRGFHGRPYEIGMAKSLLKHGRVLNNVKIVYTDGFSALEELNLRQEFSELPRGSKTCQVELLKLNS